MAVTGPLRRCQLSNASTICAEFIAGGVRYDSPRLLRLSGFRSSICISLAMTLVMYCVSPFYLPQRSVCSRPSRSRPFFRYCWQISPSRPTSQC